MDNTTESASRHQNLHTMPVHDILEGINQEDMSVPVAVGKALPQVEKLVEGIVPRMQKGGRLFYIGAGTSGRLGIVDASECPPTYGVPHDMVIGLIAGGDVAIRKAVEFAEDDREQAWKDLQEYNLTENDTVVGIAASGRTPYVLGGVEQARKAGLLTGCITCNEGSELAALAEAPVEVITGPEFVTGSTRMKAGTAQKLVLNMLTTAVMIRLGRVKGNKMVNMQLSNNKLVERGTRMLMEELSIGQEKARLLLNEHGSVQKALEEYRK
ncbi:MAG: N-acetylmuramic acid 6-phosphate etherase [Cyclobacteriaceae bacterium]